MGTRATGSDSANAGANNGPGSPWTDLDGATAQWQVKRRLWTVLDVFDLATDL
jgi:hypothetical protein